MFDRLRTVIDCDPGIDDAMALFFGLQAPEIDVVAITTVWGNVDVATTTANALRLLEIADRPEIPVAAGAARPLVGPMPRLGEAIHGADGQGNTNLPPPTLKPAAESAVDLLIRLAHVHPGELTLVAIGPLTNIAMALIRDPAIARLYRKIVIMGGAFLHPGNVTRFGEANVWHDPEAAQLVFEAGWPIVAVGLDVTHTVCLTQAVLDRLLASGTPWGRHLYRITGLYLDAYASRWSKRECAMHDPLALAIAADPSLATLTPKVRVDIELQGKHTRGMTVGDFRPRPNGAVAPDANAEVVLKVDGERFLEWWMQVLGA
ncbi:MAG TPA: nucleoside hydrolase [Chloroflexota bacterium]|nr:nucleoside hydrolase [Chloroflexota bacterium]